MPPPDQDPDGHEPKIWASQVSQETLQRCIQQQLQGRTGAIDDLIEGSIFIKLNSVSSKNVDLLE